MKFWGKFSETIFNKTVGSLISLKQIPPFETFLKKGVELLDSEATKQIELFIHSQRLDNGGFANRAGQPDLYYTMFGYFVSSAMQMKKITHGIKDFLAQYTPDNLHHSIDLFCYALLTSQFPKSQSDTQITKQRIIRELTDTTPQQSSYTPFLGLLALFYLKDFATIWRLIKKNQLITLPATNLPTSLLAAQIIINKVLGRDYNTPVIGIKQSYRENGGFAAFPNVPTEDILSTSVALFALNYAGLDLRRIKPQTLSFIEKSFDNGTFMPTHLDLQSDVEYLFYGLLALDSLA